MEAVEWTKKSSFGLEQRGWLSRNFSTMARLVEIFVDRRKASEQWQEINIEAPRRLGLPGGV